MRAYFNSASSADLVLSPDIGRPAKLRTAFAVREVGFTTGRRVISNLNFIQEQVAKTLGNRISVENVTFEHLDVPSTVRYMAGVHTFVSVHGAGMTNSFFMSPGAAVLEIIPFPLCTCRSTDYFYGLAGYYQGMSLAAGLRHYMYCVPPSHQMWYSKTPSGQKEEVAVSRSIPPGISAGGKCSWKHLHSVDSIELNALKFTSLLRLIERDFVSSDIFRLSDGVNIINLNPHANG
jgi:hypothetical protein